MKTTTTLACAVLAGLLGPTHTAPAGGGAEFEAVVLDGVPLPSTNPITARAVNGAGQIAFANGSAPNALVFVEVDGDGFTWTEFVDPIWSYTDVAMNASGMVAARMADNASGLGGYSAWTADGVQTVISTTPGFPGNGPGITDDGTVAWNRLGITSAWTSDGGVVEIGGTTRQCATTKTVWAAPGGRLAVKNATGIFCTGGVGYTTWTNAQQPPEVTNGILSVSCTSMWGITDSGKLLVFGDDFGDPCGFGAGVRLYDVATGAYEELPDLNVGVPLFINNDEWVATRSGLLHRNGITEDLASLVPGIDELLILAMGENGHFLGQTIIDGQPVLVLIRPAVDDPGPDPDFNGDGDVDVEDLLVVLAAWGPAAGHPADLNGDGFVGIADLVILLGQWGQP